MTLASDLVRATRRHLDGGSRRTLNQLAADLTADINATTAQFMWDLGGIQAGSVLCVGLEELYVWSTDQAAKTALVTRGYNNDVATLHTAGSTVEVNPKNSSAEIFGAINDDLVALSTPNSGLFAVTSVTFTAISGQIGYDLTSTPFLDVVDVVWPTTNNVSREWRTVKEFHVERDLPVGTFPSGTALFIDGEQPTPGQTVYVHIRRPFTALAALTDDVTTTGLPATAVDLPPMGAAIKVMSGRPIARADYRSQGDTRRADEVRVGDVVQAPAALRALRAERISEEAARLRLVWPDRLRPRVRL